MIDMKVCKLHMCTIVHTSMHITTRVVVVAIGDVFLLY